MDAPVTEDPQKNNAGMYVLYGVVAGLLAGVIFGLAIDNISIGIGVGIFVGALTSSVFIARLSHTKGPKGE